MHLSNFLSAPVNIHPFVMLLIVSNDQSLLHVFMAQIFSKKATERKHDLIYNKREDRHKQKNAK